MGKKPRNVRSRRAVSPVIATVILVAIAITVAVAVAYWMGGIAGQYTRFEQIEIQSATCEKVVENQTAFYWEILVKLKNTGTRDATMISAYINEREVDLYGEDTKVDNSYVTNMTTTTYITSGNSTVVAFWLDDYHDEFTLTSGTTVNLKIHSSGGMDYPKLIELV